MTTPLRFPSYSTQAMLGSSSGASERFLEEGTPIAQVSTGGAFQANAFQNNAFQVGIFKATGGTGINVESSQSYPAAWVRDFSGDVQTHERRL